MNRFHAHLNVVDPGASIRFYTQLFAAPPAVVKDGYAQPDVAAMKPKVDKSASCCSPASACC